jgi:hypothetical protein
LFDCRKVSFKHPSKYEFTSRGFNVTDHIGIDPERVIELHAQRRKNDWQDTKLIKNYSNDRSLLSRDEKDMAAK